MATTSAAPLELEPRQPGRGVALVQVLALAGAAALIVLTAPSARWSPWPLAVIAVFTVVSDVTAVDSGSKLKVSGTSLGLMLAVVLLGGGPAAVIALVTLLVGWVVQAGPRCAAHVLRNDAAVFAWFLLITGFFFHAAVRPDADVMPHEPGTTSWHSLAFVLSLVAQLPRHRRLPGLPRSSSRCCR